MSTYILDTSITTLHQYRHAVVIANLHLHSQDQIYVTTVTIEESWIGCFTMMRKSKTNRQLAFASSMLANVTTHLAEFSVLPLSETALNQFDTLVKLNLNIGRNDLRIAAAALDIDATVVTANIRDFNRVPGLKWEDWSK